MSRKKTRRETGETFICLHCGNAVSPTDTGSIHRNHCPFCLHSRHMDIIAGDRKAGCRSLMNPISIWIKDNGEWAIIHRCNQCGILRTNRIAADDDEAALFTLAASFISRLPFPAERPIERLYEIITGREKHDRKLGCI